MTSTQGIKAGRAYIELGVGDKLTAGLKRAQARPRAFGAGVTAWDARAGGQPDSFSLAPGTLQTVERERGWHLGNFKEK